MASDLRFFELSAANIRLTELAQFTSRIGPHDRIYAGFSDRRENLSSAYKQTGPRRRKASESDFVRYGTGKLSALQSIPRVSGDPMASAGADLYRNVHRRLRS